MQLYRTMKPALASLLGCALGVATAQAADSPLRGGTIGYVLTAKNVAIWQSPDGKVECPEGVNDGPREQFKTLYPMDAGVRYKFVETQLEREGQIWNPTTEPEPKLHFKEAQGTTAIGMNLDGKTGPRDFTSPDGEPGIDNQMYRVLGCVDNYRGPDGSYRHFIQDYMRKFNYNRFLVELTNVDDLTNDEDVAVTLYRGKDPLIVDTLGAYTPGSTHRIDFRWGKSFIYQLRGKIKDGVLTTEPADVTFPESQARGVPYLSVRAWRVKLKLTPENAEGLMAGYTDIERYYNSLGQNWSTHHRSYGAEPMTSEYRSMRKNAEGYPDPTTGENTAISMAWEIKFVQAYILHEERGEQAISSLRDASQRPEAVGE
ncbi:hypothetical protein [Steroidobacter agaridevorans]|uniref:hypothetical protein n=1 Tax=Steroidobacter agaridevorans TaxID=2695856 RepID=UPI0013290105|nr:hypothetical protein [Steroidobacter agaridevorans]GFE89861.1 hypothetical protein GCM10011488_48150 [Steroidobacter agaridevorans]